MKVAWIGLGRIGKPMAMRVLGAGHALNGHARTPDKHRDLEQAGGHLTASPVDAVADADVVCVNVYSEPQLRAALVESGAIAAMAPGAVVAIHSTVGPAAIAELAAIRSDVAILDAAFSGTDASAAAGTIALMVGGTEAALDKARPVLSAYADFIAHVGPSGAGMTMKLVNNALFGAQMQLAYDALRILVGSGIDKDVAVATLARSSGGSFALGRFGGAGSPEAVMEGVRPYMEKDVEHARIAAREADFDLGMLEIATRPFVTGVTGAIE
ncbi:MAG: NAD(P)-dependent oxidoreductase [Sphingobium sp.]